MQTADALVNMAAALEEGGMVRLHMACARATRQLNQQREDATRREGVSPRLPRRQTWGNARTAGAASRNCGTSVRASRHKRQLELLHWHAIPRPHPTVPEPNAAQAPHGISQIPMQYCSSDIDPPEFSPRSAAADLHGVRLFLEHARTRPL